jgi:oxygen-dependent protoporphyrinogen oxidase
VERVELRDDRVIVTDRQGTRIQARRLICAVPAHQVRKLLPNVSEAVDKIPYRPLWTVVANCPLDLNDDYPYGDTFGFLAARDGGTRLLGVVFHSSTFPSLAPPDSHTLTCFLGGAKDPDIANLESTSVGELCLRELERVLWLECNLVATQFWPRAIPQYHLGHRDLVQQIETNLPPNVALAGNYLRGVSLEDTARSGRDALDSVGSP